MTDLSLNAPISMLFVRAAGEYQSPGLVANNVSIPGSAGMLNVPSSPGSGNVINTTQSYQTNSNYAGYYWPFYDPYRTYYQNCYHVIPNADKFETAFKLGRKLMEKNLTKPMKTIEDFFKLMDTIVEVL